MQIVSIARNMNYRNFLFKDELESFVLRRSYFLSDDFEDKEADRSIIGGSVGLWDEIKRFLSLSYR